MATTVTITVTEPASTPITITASERGQRGATGATGPNVANSATTTSISGLVAGDGANLQQYAADAVVFVIRGATDAANGTNLATAYTAAKALTPGGAALSATNRACVLIPPGGYALTATLDLDTDFVDLVAMCPEKGGDRLAADDDDDAASYFRPSRTVVYCAESDTTTIQQSTRDIRLVGFSIAQTHTATGDARHAFYCSLDDANANDRSVYDSMYFYHYKPASTRLPLLFEKHVDGTWRNCISNAFGWRVGASGNFRAQMTDCQVGAYGIGGDASGASFTTCRLERCRCIGTVSGSTDGYGGFGGCSSWGSAATSDAWFIDCESGERSFNLSKTAAGNYVRCRAGDYSFGANLNVASNLGTFSGYAEDCVGGTACFGGSTIANKGVLSGELLRCKSTGATKPWRCQGATVRGSRLVQTTVNQDCISLLDSNSSFTTSDLIVNATGTGVCVNAASAQNVVVAHCRMNNADVDADGLGSNVTNLIATPYNVIDDDIS